MARTEWHFGGGSKYCSGCQEQKLPCSKGEEDPITHKRCPYVEHAPTTQEGFELWDILANHAQFKCHPDGTVMSFDLGQTLEVAKAFRYDTKALLSLMPHAQQGLQTAITKISKKE